MKFQLIQNPGSIFGGADTSDDFIITDDLDGAISDSDDEDFVIVDDLDGA
ncbi:hypothetical protein H2O64_01665 [Kordia sp. YSTF-M3]|uniref:Adhesin n=1 Tax=Kordia aestuariivivens TaxID=2759037 RepID=A0ABR7Q4C0_9FLAO|nr:hypothetical protein [Kordia aestuariivivens]MBC8753358.1 hypothetical protein [Kordia aestuariivivens]